MEDAAAVDCEVPAAVKESAVEAESGSILPIGPGTDDPFGPDEDEFPWANDDYSLKDEDAEKKIDELEMEKFFGQNYDWKNTDTQ